MIKKIIVNKGDTYSKLTIISELPARKKPNGKFERVVSCKCVCGTVKDILLRSLRSGNTTSCGCFQKEVVSTSNKTHGYSKTRQYQIWENMVARCTNPKSPSYEGYGGKGIVLCSSWRTFSNFWEDMKDNYHDNLTLDRIKGDGGYCKENCRWVDFSVQGYNKDLRKNNPNGHCGVNNYNNKQTPYAATITKNHVTYNLGKFSNLEDAIQARKQAEIFFYGFYKFTGEELG